MDVVLRNVETKGKQRLERKRPRLHTSRTLRRKKVCYLST
jgi:hypothetical protein